MKKHEKDFVIDAISGDKICSCGCGEVLESRMQSEDNFVVKQLDSINSQKNKQNSVVIPQRHDLGLGSRIPSKLKKDFAGKDISNENRLLGYRISKLNRNTNRITMSDRRLAGILERFNNIREILKLTKTISNDVVYYLKKLEKSHVLSNKKVDVVLIVVISIVVKQHNLIIPKREFLRIYNFRPSLFLKYVTEFTKILKIEPSSLIPDSFSSIHAITNKLSLDKKIHDGAIEILENCKKDKLHLNSGTSAAAAAIYVSGMNLNINNHLVLEDIAEAAGVTSVTIRNYKEKMLPVLNKMNLTATVSKSSRFYGGKKK